MALLSINPGVGFFHKLSISVASFYENVFANVVPSFMHSWVPLQNPVLWTNADGWIPRNT